MLAGNMAADYWRDCGVTGVLDLTGCVCVVLLSMTVPGVMLTTGVLWRHRDCCDAQGAAACRQAVPAQARRTQRVVQDIHWLQGLYVVGQYGRVSLVGVVFLHFKSFNGH
jgi:hypothetical protein